MTFSSSRSSQLYKLAIPLFAKDIRAQTFGWLIPIVTLVVLLNGLNVVNSYVGRGFMTSLARREVPAFYTFTFYYIAVFLASTIVAVFYQFFQDRLALFWRQSLTQHLVAQYLTNDAYYHLHARTEIDNADQRLSEDVRSFSTTLLSFFLLILNSSITIVSFAFILWSISHWLFGVALIYSIVGSLTTLLLGYRLVGLDYLQLAKEADLRYGLIRIREYAEPIALLHGEPEEDEQVRGRLAMLVDVVKRVIAVNRNIGFFTSFFNYMVPILPVIIVAPVYLRGEIEFGEVTQSAMAFAQLLGSLAVFIAQFQNISAFMAVVTRLGALQHAISEASAPTVSAIRVRKDDTRVAYDKLTLKTPHEDRTLISELTLDIPHGQRLLIQGDDGAGKSALFRATAGLWSSGFGTVVCPRRDQMMFLPQKPYTVYGTLRDQMTYGLHDHATTNDQLQKVMRDLNLQTIVNRVGGLDVERDWPATLSVGEQQLLALARLLLANPCFAFLDQATNSLDPARGKRLYKLLAASSISYLSVGDPTHIREFHDRVLDLSEDGTWTTETVRKSKSA